MKIKFLKLLCLLLVITTTYGDEEVITFTRNNPLDLPEDNVFISRKGEIYDVYQTGKEVRNLLVPLIGYSGNPQFDIGVNSLPPIYYNLVEDGVNLGQYVVINKIQHKINDGRDSAADSFLGYIQVTDNNVYIGTEDGIYTYNPDTKEVQKYGNITADIIAIDKVGGKDEIYILTANHKIYKVTQEGTVKTQVRAIDHAEDFVLDLQEGIYFSSRDKKPQLLVKGEKKPYKLKEFNFDIVNPVLVRPVFGSFDMESMQHYMPYIVDGVLYILNPPNQSIAIPEINAVPGITAFNAEFMLFHYYAVDGKIYLHNIFPPLESEFKQGTKKQGTSDGSKPLRVFQRDTAVDFDNFKKLIRSKQKS